MRGDFATKGADIASSASIDPGALQGYSHDITGTTNITSLGTVAAGIVKVLKFEGALNVVHNATSLILKHGQNHLTVDGDVLAFMSEGSGNWRELWRNVAGGDVPPGVVMPDAGTSAPAGWLHCYGQAVSRTTYAAIFARLSTTYGVGDGALTFNLPDLRGRIPAGQDDMGGSSANRLTGLTNGIDGDALGGTGGVESNTITTTYLPASGLSIPSLTVSGTVPSAYTTGAADASDRLFKFNPPDGSLGTQNTTAISASTGTGTTGNMGTGTALNNVQPTLILNYAIKC